MSTIRELQRRVGEINIANGWRKDDAHSTSTDKQIVMLADIGTEVSEAIEELRNGRGVAETYFPTAHPFGVGPNAAPPKPEGVPSELADIVIRALDCADAWGIDLEQMVELKLAHNASRGHRHGRETRMRSKAKAAATVAYPDDQYIEPGDPS